MKNTPLFMLTPVALSMALPFGATASELNLRQISQYGNVESQDQVTSISQFTDLQPTDWAYQALANLTQSYGCVAGYPDGTFRGQRAITRYEAAALLNACLDRITETTDELKKLLREFEKELALLRGRVDGLEARVGELEAIQFSTTTKLKGKAFFTLGSVSYTGNTTQPNGEPANLPQALSFNYDLRLTLDTSFTGKDLLRTRLRAANYASTAFFGDGPTGLTSLDISFQSPLADDVVAIERLYYLFPLGQKFTANVAARAKQEDLLAFEPSVYPAGVLDFFTYNGAPGAYSHLRGSGAGLWWKDKGWSISANYVAKNGNRGNPNASIGQGGGGLGNASSVNTGTLQLGYQSKSWGAALAYGYNSANAGYYNTGIATNKALEINPVYSLGGGRTNSLSIAGYWQPIDSGLLPAISAGYGYNANSYGGQLAGLTSNTQSWSVAFNWNNVFAKGNEAGFAIGQAPFYTGGNSAAQDRWGGPNDGNWVSELWYAFKLSNHVTLTPAVFYVSNQHFANGNEGVGSPFNVLGGILITKFVF